MDFRIAFMNGIFENFILFFHHIKNFLSY